MRIRGHLLMLQVTTLGVISLGAAFGWLVSHQLEKQARRQHAELELQGSQAAHVAFDLLEALPSLASYSTLDNRKLKARIHGDVEALGHFREHLDEHLNTLPISNAEPHLRQELQEIRLHSIELEASLNQSLEQLGSNPDAASRSRSIDALMREQTMLDMRHHGDELARLYDRIEARTVLAQQGQDRAITSGIVISASILLIGWIIGLAISTGSSRTMLRPLVELEGLMLEPPGDLEARLHSLIFQQAPREIASLSQSFLKLHTRVASLVENLARQARTDSLTDVGNRRQFEEALESEWMRGDRSDETVSLLMLDVDHFKAYNDHYGHPEGDTCLRRIAGAIRSQTRGSLDQVCRIGGEEFAVLLPGTSSTQAEALARRILNAVDELAIPHGYAADGPGWVTVSIGLASTRPGASTNAADLVKRTDSALYERKRNQGRHGVTIATEAS